ncbi:MAG: lamin tail domain-containing protein [Verrucomicrobiales bacterium]|nr:lamin tail domain-containing protein [Verrucomicrobiales bacterium]
MIRNSPSNHGRRDAGRWTAGARLLVGLLTAASGVATAAEPDFLEFPNLALGREAYMVRYQDNLPPASNGNDGNPATEVLTTDKSVDAYWEVDLGEPYALYGVRTLAANGFQARMTHATVRLFDERHGSVFARHLSGGSATFDVALPGPVRARFVRVGFENKERSHPTGGIEWYLGIKEVEAYGRPLPEVGLLGFTAEATAVHRGDPVRLTWSQNELDRLELHPGIGSVLAATSPAGLGAWTVSPEVSTEYLLVGTNRCGVYARGVAVEVDGGPLPVRINEFVARNRLSLRDGRGDTPDWIELYNPGASAVDLAGYGLSDDPARPMRWVFPSVTIPAHGYLLVRASGRNESIDAAGGLHANFQLDAEGEGLWLTAADGATTLDAVERYPAQDEDLAYGRTLDGEWAFLEPTPGALNLATRYAGWLPPVEFSQSRGFQTNAFALTLTHPDPDAQVLYSYGGREPYRAYPGPLSIARTTTVRATVQRAGYRSPRVQTHSYIFLRDVIGGATMDPAITQDARYAKRLEIGLRELPSLSVTVPELPDDYVERPASVEIFWPDNAPAVQANCGMHRFGGAWTTFDKKNYRLKFRTEYGTPKLEAPLFRGFDHGFLAVDTFDELDLRGGSHDMASRGFYMSARFNEDTMLDMGSLNPHGRFVHLYLNGAYWGQYHLRERLNDRFLADYLGGPAEDYLTVRGNDNVGSSFIPGTPDPPDREPWEWVRANRASYATVRARLDVPHLVDFMLSWFYGNAETEYRAAGPRAPGSGFKFWLADADGFLRDSGDSTSNPGPGGLFGALTAERDPEFMILLADRIHRHLFNDGALTPERNRARLEARMEEIANSLLAECARWSQRTPDNWVAAANDVRNGLFRTRTAALISQLRARGLYPAVDAPAFNQNGGAVTNGFTAILSAGSGTLYYTLDGSDPRLPGGAVAPGAIAWDGGATWFPLGAEWRYWDRGTLPSPNWHQRGYNPIAWATGAAPLGYGNGDEATTLDFGEDAANKRITAYFRRQFNVPAANPEAVLTVELVRDDGAAVYLNGVEVVRDNLPTGALDPDTRALTAVGGSAETQANPFVLPAGNLVAGDNVLAVEVHQANPTSSDLRFDLALHAPAAKEIAITGDTVIRARVRTGNTWSALAEAAFTTVARVSPRPGDVLFTEVHYNPDGSDDGEFLEVQNRTGDFVDLTGVRLDDGVEFLFPDGFTLAPGQCAVVVENLATFDARYRDATSPWFAPDISVAGQWSGRLSDEGETITLLDAGWEPLAGVTYGTSNDWPQRANGAGSSLELREPDAVPDDPAERDTFLARAANWRSSGLYHGSPGRLDLAPRTLVISEVLAHSDLGEDWVELQNLGPEPADLTGLHLTDHLARPTRYGFPEETVIPAGGFLILTSNELGFGFSELGSDVLLLRVEGTNILRFVDTVDFPAVEREETFGRHERSDGRVDFTELAAPTPDGANAGPRVGPVVFSEIMYRPAAGRAEYIELLNPTAAAIPLFDPARPGNPWVLSGAVDFAFPPDQWLAAGARLLVCAIDPASFRTQYPVPDGIPIHGPWSGALNNAGESVKLRRPGDPEPDGTIPYYRVDRVSYEPVAPWPVAANRGDISLERVSALSYGNDPASWRASAPGGSPGSGAVGGNNPPVLEPFGDFRHPADIPFEFQLTASDPDAPPQSLRFSAEGLPPGIKLVADEGRLTGRPSASGIFAVAVTVTDDGQPALTDRQAFTWEITAPFRLVFDAPEPGSPPAFRFQALAGERYEVQYSDRLESAAWRFLAAVDADVDGWQSVALPPNPGNGSLFLRVLWVR